MTSQAAIMDEFYSQRHYQARTAKMWFNQLQELWSQPFQPGPRLGPSEWPLDLPLSLNLFPRLTVPSCVLHSPLNPSMVPGKYNGGRFKLSPDISPKPGIATVSGQISQAVDSELHNCWIEINSRIFLEERAGISGFYFLLFPSCVL